MAVRQRLENDLEIFSGLIGDRWLRQRHTTLQDGQFLHEESISPKLDPTMSPCYGHRVLHHENLFQPRRNVRGVSRSDP